jgi:hypothetical protein
MSHLRMCPLQAGKYTVSNSNDEVLTVVTVYWLAL